MQVDWESGPTEIVPNWAPHLLSSIQMIGDYLAIPTIVYGLNAPVFNQKANYQRLPRFVINLNRAGEEGRKCFI